MLAVVLVASLAGGCSGGGQGRAAGPATARPTPLTKLVTGRVTIARATFCDQVASAAVRRALGGQPGDAAHWDTGAPVPTTSGDLGHEIGCAWTTTTGAAARAWVFARPVTADLAGTLVAQASHQAGCTAAQASHFGSPSLLQTCSQPGGTERVRRAGLFGDTWLTCELSGPASSQPRRHVDDWCAAVVASLRTG